MNALRRAVVWGLLFSAMMAVAQGEPAWLALAPASALIYLAVSRIVKSIHEY